MQPDAAGEPRDRAGPARVRRPELGIDQAVQQVRLPPVVPRERPHRDRPAPTTDPTDPGAGEHAAERPQVPAEHGLLRATAARSVQSIAIAEDKAGNTADAMKHLKLVLAAQAGVKPDVMKKAQAKLDEMSMKVGIAHADDRSRRHADHRSAATGR